ncbi:MAG TPA: arginine--tRNA ligase, partial [Desulfobacterales bacterium]|nr:arginine--tRNA ligase [Desulfobacterales bacterium]
RILSFCGYGVEREFYINDAGEQIRLLGESIYSRFRQNQAPDYPFPEKGYHGEYIHDLAEAVSGKADLGSLDREEAVTLCAQRGKEIMLQEIREDLRRFRVDFDSWYSEMELYGSALLHDTLEAMRARGYLYEKDGALWIRTSDFGDDKDRVIRKGDGRFTYFASDIAYHLQKHERGFTRAIDIWGADHHGYVPRVSASIRALGYDGDRFQVLLIQLVNLLRGGNPVAMSTRAGEFVTLREVIDEVGRDAARFLFLLRHYESPLDFDLELAKRQSNDNPVYYVQYVHARISNILKKAEERGYTDIRWRDEFSSILTLPDEIQLTKLMARYPEVVATSARLMEPHRIPFYMKELSAAFHAYYHDRKKHKVVSDDAELSAARLYLVSAIRTIIRNGLALMGVSAPESM